jgi:hypothetical protein
MVESESEVILSSYREVKNRGITDMREYEAFQPISVDKAHATRPTAGGKIIRAVE